MSTHVSLVICRKRSIKNGKLKPASLPGLRRSMECCASLMLTRKQNHSFEVCGHLVDAGLDAGLVLIAAWRAGGPGRGDHVVADLDRQRTARWNHVAEPQATGIGSLGDVVGELAGGNALAARG